MLSRYFNSLANVTRLVGTSESSLMSIFGVKADDPATYATVCGILLAVAITASLVPAIRAARLDPVRALRDE